MTELCHFCHEQKECEKTVFGQWMCNQCTDEYHQILVDKYGM
jgi:ribosomal protein L37AE/L43A